MVHVYEDETHCDRHGTYNTSDSPCPECENERLKADLAKAWVIADMLADFLEEALNCLKGTENDCIMSIDEALKALGTYRLAKKKLKIKV